MRCVLVVLLVLCACTQTRTPTQVTVVVDSDLAPDLELTRIEVVVLARDGQDSTLSSRTFPLAAREAPKRYTLPLSFALVPAAENSLDAFVLVVTGYGASGSEPIVEQQAIARFVPGAARRLDVFLRARCVAQLCWQDGQRGDRTCDEAGECRAVDEVADLPPSSSGPLAGYTPVASGVRDSDAGLQTMEDANVAEAGASSSTCDPDPCTALAGRVCEPSSGRCVCDDKCSAVGQTRCQDGAVSVCRPGTAGCLAWEPVRQCERGCGDASSCAGCENECNESGRGECAADSVRLCTADEAGCLVLAPSTPCADKNPCTTDRCNAQLGRCENSPDDALCTAHAGNACVKDYCDVAQGGCARVNLARSCDDGQACTRADTCQAGVCAGTLDSAMAGCSDLCPDDPKKTAPGTCGCGTAEQTADSDGDGTIDCRDACPNDECSTLGTTCASGRVTTCGAGMGGCKTRALRTCSSGFCFDGSHCGVVTEYAWGSGEQLAAKDVKLDAQGNAYVVGTAFSALAGNTYAGGEGGDPFITKWSPTGQRLWSYEWGESGIGAEGAMANALNDSGDRLAVIGSDSAGSAWVGLWSTGARAAPLWLVKVSPSSSVVTSGSEVAFGPSGDVYVAGTVGASASLPGETALGKRDAFAARLDVTNGALVWTRQVGSTQNDDGLKIAADASSVYLAGEREKTDDNANGNVFVTRFDGSGNYFWERILNLGSSDYLDALASDGSGSLAISHSHDGAEAITRLTSANIVSTTYATSTTISGALHAGNFYAGTFGGIVKYDPTGAKLWEHTLPGRGYSTAVSARSLSSGDVRIVFTGTHGATSSTNSFLAVVTSE